MKEAFLGKMSPHEALVHRCASFGRLVVELFEDARARDSLQNGTYVKYDTLEDTSVVACVLEPKTATPLAINDPARRVNLFLPESFYDGMPQVESPLVVWFEDRQAGRSPGLLTDVVTAVFEVTGGSFGPLGSEDLEPEGFEVYDETLQNESLGFEGEGSVEFYTEVAQKSTAQQSRDLAYWDRIIRNQMELARF